MGTLGHGIYNHLKHSKNTTESTINIQKFLYEMTNKKIKIVAMEISSHSIVQNRISGLSFSIAILTNITPEHLDYHKTMENYIRSKWLFFSKFNIKTFIINADDRIGFQWIKKMSLKNVITITINRNFNPPLSKKWINANKILDNNNHTYIYFHSSWGNGLLKSQLIGIFNVSNLLLALAATLELGYPLDFLIKTCKFIKTICGRMQTFHSINKPKIIIDYAHNPDSLKNLLTTLKIKYNKKLWCIFGCGGNRDQTKRAKMGAIAENLSDKIILTNDNPRNENPIKIISNILEGCKNKKNIIVIVERKDAIKFAITQADKKDLIVIAGKGHETYQIIGDNYYYFSDHKIVTKLLE